MQSVCVCDNCHHVFHGRRVYHYEGEKFCSRHCLEDAITKYSWNDEMVQGDLFLPQKVPRDGEEVTQTAVR